MLQYFLGFEGFEMADIFDYTLLCKYRKLFGIDQIKLLNDKILEGKETSIFE